MRGIDIKRMSVLTGKKNPIKDLRVGDKSTWSQ
jgi:hypothetical protein